MDLPTYTNIWRIEKRLYKLYDLRLPTPLPIVWIGGFVGVLAPWSLLLYLLGLPFAAPWHVLYLVPPGVVTWLSTRPVIESKRLTELLQSQMRYMGEPRTWCRMAPISEPAEVALNGRVWRAAPQPASVRVKASRKARHAQSKRAAARSREVRPAVAAAAAAAATAPVARERVAWGEARALRQGTAPALAQTEAVRPTPVAVPVLSAVPRASLPVVPPEPAPAETVASLPDTPVPGPSSRPTADGSAGRPKTRQDRPPVREDAEDTPATPDTPDTPEAPAAPISTEALRRLRRLAASAEAQRAAAPPEQPASPEPEASPEISVPASRSPVRERPEAPAVPPPSPSAPEPARGETPAKGRTVPAERPAVVPDPVEKPSTPTVPSFVPRFVGPAPAGRRDAEAAELSPDDRSARREHRRGRPTPIGRAADTAKAWPPERPAGTQAGPGIPGDTGVQTGAGMSIRAVPSGAAKADPVAPVVPVPTSSAGEAGARVRRVESVVGRDSSGGWRRLAQVVIGPGGGRTDGSEIDEARARAVFSGSRRVVVLGCTGGAGQTTTALMLGHTLARYREDRILAVDASTGSHALSSRIQGESPETLSSLLAGLDNVQGYLGMRAYTSRCASGLEVLAGDTDAGAEQRLSDRTLFSDRRLGQTMDTLDRYYKMIVMDPAAALAARVLPYADQLVLVVPASEDGPDAVAMTYEWLDGHGCADLRRRAVMVVNGVSRRSMEDVEQAEAVARGRCRAIVRVPWEDALAPGRADRVEPSHLRAPGRRAYLALAGVVVAGFGTVQAGRPSEEELAQ
ncbi:TcpE family conjugal transfer membrane protein [Streptosporangium sp. NPDC006013]|uniref:TcpE family conjugal transfer membrane protein n=1 Tax=Streptosporangium sp. NPDC006013 TaxID=3155596 RepID=UPI0033A4BCA1